MAQCVYYVYIFPRAMIESSVSVCVSACVCLSFHYLSYIHLYCTC